METSKALLFCLAAVVAQVVCDESGQMSPNGEAAVLSAERKEAKARANSSTEAVRSVGAAPFDGVVGTRNIIKGYHQTSPEACQSILKNGFHLGEGGLCGKAVYFAVSPQATAWKAITTNSQGGCMLECEVDAGRVGYYQADGPLSNHVTNGHKEHWCGKYSSMTEEKLRQAGYDTIHMRRPDGPEIVLFDPTRILSIKKLHFKCNWMCMFFCQKHWPSYCHHMEKAGAKHEVSNEEAADVVIKKIGEAQNASIIV